ncbi:hypothetical protein LHJ74_17775 [Streptomyces sp. N2-109]|uniref:Uncharacterized protein n=1 Tax=Streptomyces gossypii TaxID=2883101 RepID=A0ABT2JVM7_9ACTN|nr:hypothetical protein [Streptomyces gossypii]MCT2591723.1 hypothetical protein [Streptomyces gossypii]
MAVRAGVAFVGDEREQPVVVVRITFLTIELPTRQALRTPPTEALARA